MIEINQVSKSFDDGHSYSVRDVSFTVDEDETLVILGSSGSGKSSILKMINRLIIPTAGTIKVDGQLNSDYSLTELRRKLGYVFQETGLFPHMTVADNIAITLRIAKQPKADCLARAMILLSLVGLDPDVYCRRYPLQLSGGEQQRVGVARALANDPDYLLMDEPFGALDPVTRDELQVELMRIKNMQPKTIIFVTHDVFEALRIADRIAIMDNGELLQIGNKEQIIQQPANEFVRQLFQKPFEQLKRYNE